MSRWLSLLVVAAACLGTSGLIVYASDWVEDESVQSTRAPRPAPPRRQASSPSVPLPAPSRNPSSGLESADSTPTFQVRPRSHGSAPPLQANVSKWGEADKPNQDYLQGQARALQFPLQLQRPVAVSAPPQLFRGWLERNHQAFALSTSTMSSRNLVEIKGAWDDSARTLNALGLRHQSIKGGGLRSYPLDGVKVMVINCPGKVPGDVLQKIRNFVANGGYLLTTDWSLENVVERAFPGYVAYNGAKASQTMVDAEVKDIDPVLFKGAVTRAYWKVDDGSELVRVLKPQAVRVLVQSAQLSSDDPDHRGILAVNFAFGRGQVLHLVGHFDNNAGLGFRNTLPDPAPGIGISLRQAMATNFIVEGLSR